MQAVSNNRYNVGVSYSGLTYTRDKIQSSFKDDDNRQFVLNGSTPSEFKDTINSILNDLDNIIKVYDENKPIIDKHYDWED